MVLSSSHTFESPGEIITVSGSPDIVSSSWHYTGNGTLNLSGTPSIVSSIWKYTGTGALLQLLGEYEPKFSYIGSGTLVLGGEAEVIKGFFIYEGNGNIFISGDSDEEIRTKYYIYESDGNLLQVSGIALTHLTLKVAGDGKLIFSGSYTGEIVFFYGIELNWNVQQLFESGLDLRWNTGQLESFFYRIEGLCRPAADCKKGIKRDADCFEKFIHTITATSTSDLCERLKAQGIFWPIKKLERWSIPVNGNSTGCNELVPVDFCQVPACLEFCVDFDLVIDIEDDVTVITLNTENFSYITEGSLTFSGGSTLISSAWQAKGFGEILLLGDAKIISSYRTYTGSGKILVLGESEYNDSFHGLDSFIDIEDDVSIIDFSVTFSSDEEEQSIPISTESIFIKCGCGDILPVRLRLEHNLNTENKLSQFITRNRTTLEDNAVMYYDNVNKLWQKNYHFVGLSSDGITRDVWDINFDWSCTDIVGGFSLGSFIWKLGMQVFLRNIDTGLDYDTRLLVTIPTEGVCGVDGELNLRINTDVLQDSVVTDPSVTPQVTLLFDNIGLFKSRFWLDNPTFRIGIFSDQLVSSVTRLNIKPILPNFEELILDATL